MPHRPPHPIRALALVALLLALGTVVAYVALLQALIPRAAFADNVQVRPDPQDVLRAVGGL